MAVLVHALYSGEKNLEAPMRSVAEAILQSLGKRRHDLEVVLVDARFFERYRREAKRHRRLDLIRPLHTDGFNVLSFPFSPLFRSPRGTQPLGEVWLCPAYIVRHHENMLFLLVHGILHLCGYAHELRRDRIAMEAKERVLYRAVLRARISGVSSLIPPRNKIYNSQFAIYNEFSMK